MREMRGVIYFQEKSAIRKNLVKKKKNSFFIFVEDVIDRVSHKIRKLSFLFGVM